MPKRKKQNVDISNNKKKKKKISNKDCDEAFLHKYQQDSSDYYAKLSSKMLLDDWKKSTLNQQEKRHVLNFCKDKINYGIKEEEIKDIRLVTPFTLLLAGKSKCGKTHLLLDILRQWRYITDDTVGFYTKHIYWFYGTIAEKQMAEMKVIFDQFREELGDKDEKPSLHFEKGDFTSKNCQMLFDKMENAIVIIDDLMTEMTSNQQICSFFTRESHHLDINMIYLWQDIFPRQQHASTISKNTDYKILFDNPSGISSLQNMMATMFGAQAGKKDSVFKKILDFFRKSKTGSFPFVFFNVKPNQDDDMKILLNAFNNRNVDDIKNAILPIAVENLKH